MDNMNQIIQETYYGKLPEFVKIEELLAIVIKKIKDDKSSNPNKFKEMKEIEKLFCKVFGFKKAFIYWEANVEENAYTIPITSLVIFSNKTEQYITKTSKGFYDSKHKTVLTVYLAPGIVYYSDLLPQELLACILHEIGHNFDMSGYHMISFNLWNILTFGKVGRDCNKYKDPEEINKIKMKYKNKIEKKNDKYFDDDKKRQKSNRRYIEMLEDYHRQQAKNAPIDALVGAVTLPFKILFSPLSRPIKELSGLSGKKGELYADSFATAYGYGSDLVLALNKFGKPKRYYDPKNRTMKFLQDLANFQTEVYVTMNNCHGSDDERCYNCKKKLLQDLKKNDFSPEMKQELLKEIEKIDEAYKMIGTLDNNDRMHLTTTWRKVNRILFHGSPNIIQKLFKTHRE